ncbi:MAG: Serine hydroxymethyltransferase [Candidatus Wolfebacteria bacterium GW2011_GWA2_42_10]|uniref:Serine hydroxymethyltransferase n=2 Tax=Candidatus Wolfeibacteriota TaxID=1752735 RepID=A0A0G0XK98_9BACT|nr:MAG: Serine hydroxymethyltransferase [Candidatus Wolfebacteria bacterium GW2011_GWB1_41_12]KKS25324.1 MAG: Serine hydroxymethyltransferase [Candidatus Wolfebacteria bacterium GW2011_GWA2_42_10]KKT56763.1 MAG: Serine hydroxymethyltransferase [Candidatus Wolfebacteria bacterium GW2011_GWA1_44_24]
MKLGGLEKTDRKLHRFVAAEIKRQNETIDLIASENFVSPEILEVLGSPLTNKYSEGYPGKRYYPGNFYCDEIEKLAQERALKVFGLSPKKWGVNVQPYSGSPANLAIYLALMNPGDILMGMKLASGGHLTHGHKASFSGKLFKAVQYSVDEKTGLINYKEVKKLAKKHRPKIIVSGYSAYPRKIDFKRFGAIAKKVGACHLADISHVAGLVVAGLHPSPFLYADIVMTTTHKTLRGPRAAVIFSKSNVKCQMSNVSISEAIDKAVFPGMQGGPHNNVIAAIALAFNEALKPAFKKYQKQIIKNAKELASVLKNYGFDLVTGGTDNHLVLINLKNIGLNGLDAEKILESAGIIVNRNSISGDVLPFKPSGIRLGTAAIASRGFKEKEIRQIARWIYRLLIEKEKPVIIRKEVIKLTKYKKYAIY